MMQPVRVKVVLREKEGKTSRTKESPGIFTNSTF